MGMSFFIYAFLFVSTFHERSKGVKQDLDLLQYASKTETAKYMVQ